TRTRTRAHMQQQQASRRGGAVEAAAGDGDDKACEQSAGDTAMGSSAPARAPYDAALRDDAPFLLAALWPRTLTYDIVAAAWQGSRLDAGPRYAEAPLSDGERLHVRAATLAVAATASRAEARAGGVVLAHLDAARGLVSRRAAAAAASPPLHIGAPPDSPEMRPMDSPPMRPMDSPPMRRRPETPPPQQPPPQPQPPPQQPQPQLPPQQPQARPQEAAPAEPHEAAAAAAAGSLDFYAS